MRALEVFTRPMLAALGPRTPTMTRATDVRHTRAAVAAGFFLQGLVFAAIVTQAPRMQDRFDIGDGGLTGILVLVAAVSGVGSVIAGTIAERRSSAVAYRAALVTIGLSALLVALAPSAPLLVAAFAVYGLGVGGVDAGMNMQGVRVQEAYERSIMASFHGMWSVGGILGALYAAGVAEVDVPFTASLVAVAAVTLAVTAVAGRFFLDIRVDALDASTTVAPLAYGAYQGGALISRSFLIPLATVPVVLLVARSFRVSAAHQPV
jgi:MFS family permease